MDSIMANNPETEQYMTQENLISDETEEINLSDVYTLKIEKYKTDPGYWLYSKGTVYKSGKVIASVARNYSHFWYKFIEHPNGNNYLFCGADYQGYTILNLTQKTRKDYLPKEAKDGNGWCIASAESFDQHTKELQLTGCIWAGPTERMVIDFSDPDNPPYKEIRSGLVIECEDCEKEIVLPYKGGKCQAQYTDKCKKCSSVLCQECSNRNSVCWYCRMKKKKEIEDANS